jgi:hypothetical protein
VRDRKKACDDITELGDALANGDVTGERVDIFARAANGLKPSEIDKVAESGAAIAAAAANASERQYRETLDRIIGKARENDGLDQLARQRRATRLRMWTGTDGMTNLSGTLDPVLGTELASKIRNRADSMFHSGPPDTAPVDPLERQHHLAALALHDLLCGQHRDSNGPDVTVLIDADTLTSGRRHEHTILDVGHGPFGLPIETVRRWACLGTVTPVVVAADGVRLYLGRETRLANRYQRRALRALYRTCGTCDTPFEHTQMHHVSWFGRDRGLTDIDNLVPLCNRCHHMVHEGGWTLHLAPDRTLTITRPTGHTTIHAPPTRRAA